MIDLKDLRRAIEELAEERNIPAEKLLEAIETSIAAAYKKEYRQRTEVVRAKFDLKTGQMQFWLAKTVVDKDAVRLMAEIETKEGEAKEGQGGKQEEKQEEPKNPEEEEKILYIPEKHIFLEEAREIKADAQIEEELLFPLELHEDFGRIAAQTAKQVILQKIKEIEKSLAFDEFKSKEGELINGTIQRFERGHVYVDLGKTMGIMFANESVPGEMYTPGKRMRFYVLAVQKETKFPGVVLSRAHPDFVKKVFEAEIPEIADGAIEIKAVVREAGSRTKVAAISKEERIDAIGSCIGQKGSRIMSISNELNERVDVLEWSEDPAKFIANSLSPAKVTDIEILPKNEARVFMPADQLSLAIGRGGQNVRLAAKLTGWRIDVRSQEKPEEVQEGGIAESIEETSEANGAETTEQKTQGEEQNEKEKTEEKSE